MASGYPTLMQSVLEFCLGLAACEAASRAAIFLRDAASNVRRGGGSMSRAWRRHLFGCWRYFDSRFFFGFLAPVSCAWAALTWAAAAESPGGSSAAPLVSHGWRLVLFLAYFAHRVTPHSSTARQREVLSQGKLGPGLARSFFAFLENALIDACEQINYFAEHQLGDSNCSSVASFTPLILFPDLSSYVVSGREHREDSFRHPCQGLLSGVLEVEREAAEDSGVELDAANEATEEYVDQAGQKRHCSINTFSIGRKVSASDDEKMSYSYYFVVDNRPLLGLQRYFEQSEESGEDFELQLRSYKMVLGALLEDACRDGRLSEDMFRIVEFKRGKFLDALEQIPHSV